MVFSFLVNPVLIRFNLCYTSRSLSFKRLNEFILFCLQSFFLIKMYATVCDGDFMLSLVFLFAEFQAMTRTVCTARALVLIGKRYMDIG